MKSFHGNHELKEKLLRDIIEHRRLDRFRQGQFYDDSGRGCHLGCCVKSHDISLNGDWHQIFSNIYGIPLSIAYLEEFFFENLPIDKAKLWSETIIEATPVGVDLSHSYHRFMIWILCDKKFGVINYATGELIHVINHIASLHALCINNQEVQESTWAAAKDAAVAAARAAARATASSAAWAAAKSAAKSAARTAAWAAAGAASRAAAWSASRAAARNAAVAAGDAARATWDTAGDEWIYVASRQLIIEINSCGEQEFAKENSIEQDSNVYRDVTRQDDQPDLADVEQGTQETKGGQVLWCQPRNSGSY